MTEQDRLHVEIARRLYTGEDAERKNIAHNLVWHVPGHNPVSGDYHGFEEYTQVMTARMAPLTRWEFEVKNVMVNGSYVMVTVHLWGERKGKTIDTEGGHLLRIKDGKVVEGWGFTVEQDALDEFFSA